MTETAQREQFIPRLALTPGEPAGIGPDVVIEIARDNWPGEIVAICDPQLVAERAAQMGIDLELVEYDPNSPPAPSRAGKLTVARVPLKTPVLAGELSPGNSTYVIETLQRACDGCLRGEFAAMVTAPVHKGIINDAGIAFSGHTEFLATQTGADMPVMLLVADTLRVALVTTHLALRDVPDAISADRIRRILTILHAGLIEKFGLSQPRISVLGLNPHAGESGHLGGEDANIIAPVLDELRATGMHLQGPVPADTAFAQHHLATTDSILAMYHDQGLPVLKHRGFGQAVNCTLGLPIIRTSVDHGTALDLAGTGDAHAGSLRAALNLAINMHALAKS
jgi:4-hydroxythreonine-4-phosphate dehydrogenase